MNANELMIGDLVLYNNAYCRVYSIESPMSRKEERFNNKYVVTLWDNGLYSVVIDEIEPIPLTTAMLEAYGWHFDEINATWIHNECCLELFDPWIKNGGYVLSSYNSITFKFVHELQHALRLCGLIELAYNFNV